MHPAARILTLQSLVCPVWLFPSSLLFSLSLSLSFSLSSTVTVCLLPGLTPSSSFFALFSLLSAFSFLFFSSFFLSYFILHPSLISISATYFYPDCPCHSFFFSIRSQPPITSLRIYQPHLSLSKPPSLPPFLHLRQLVSACSLSSSTILFSLLLLLLDLRLHQSVPSIDFFRT